MPLKLEASGFRLEIGVARIENLKLHEEIVSSYLLDLAETIEKDGKIRNPIIVDRESGVVLDGMHRVAAISYLGYDKIPACFVHYQDPELKLGSWCRVFKNLAIDEVLELCEDLGFEIKETESSHVKSSMEKKLKKLFLVSKSNYYQISHEADTIKEIFVMAEDLEEAIVKEGFEPKLVPEKGILEKLTVGETAILIPPAKKEEVIEISQSKTVFSHKMTRHIIPARPLNVDVPLELLKEDLQRVDEKITKKLNNLKIEHLPPGSTFEGREYEEELVIFKTPHEEKDR